MSCMITENSSACTCSWNQWVVLQAQADTNSFFGGEIWFAFFISAPPTYAQKEQPWLLRGLCRNCWGFVEPGGPLAPPFSTSVSTYLQLASPKLWLQEVGYWRAALEQGFLVLSLCPGEHSCCEPRESNGRHAEHESQACWQCSDPAQRGWFAVELSGARKHRLPSSGRMRKRVGFLARAYTCVCEAEVAGRLLTARLGSWSRSGLADDSPTINDPPTLSVRECCCQTNIAVHGQSQNEETLSREEMRTSRLHSAVQCCVCSTTDSRR